MTSFYHGHWVLTFLIFFPLVVGAACLLAPRERARWIALAGSLIEFAVSLPLFWTFQATRSEIQNFVSIDWVPDWGIAYAVGVDGISLLLVLLTTFLLPISVLVSWNQIREKERAYYAMLLLLGTGMIGVFLALDLFLFYIFWEASLVPMYFLVGVWGHDRRIYAAVKFFLYTAFGSLLMLVAILVLFWLHLDQFGVASFAYVDLLRADVPGSLQLWLFIAFALAFAIKVPLFPFHTWLPDAHVEAPTAGSVILAGVLLKMGIYGFLRFAIPFFPAAALDATVLWVVLGLGLAGIIYTAWVAAVQPNIKKLIAYTSVAHLGFIVVGTFALNPQSVVGGILQMVNHGLSTGALFILAGFLYERRHTYEISAYGGLARVVPLLSAALVVSALASIGLPGLNGFVGEFLILIGTFRSHPWVAVLATAGVIFAAYYMLPMVRRVVWNDLDREENAALVDLAPRELAIIVPLLALIVLLGVYPRPFLERIEPAATALTERIVLTPTALEAQAPHAPAASAAAR